MNKRKIWIFGCSFSAGYGEVTMDETYGNLLSSEIEYDIKNMSVPGNSNDKIVYDLLTNLSNINDGDIIIYQFSSTDRIGFFMNDTNFFTTSGLIQMGIQGKIMNSFKYKNENIYAHTSIGKLETLVDYIKEWQPHRKRFDLENAINVLKFLIKEKKYPILSIIYG